MFLYHYRWCGKCWSESQGTHFFQKLEITLRKRLPWIICPTMTNISIKRSRLGKLCLATTHDQVESSFFLPKYSHIIKNEFAVFCHLTWYVTKFIVHKDYNYRYHLCSRSCISSVWYMAYTCHITADLTLLQILDLCDAYSLHDNEFFFDRQCWHLHVKPNVLLKRKLKSLWTKSNLNITTGGRKHLTVCSTSIAQSAFTWWRFAFLHHYNPQIGFIFYVNSTHK